MTTFKIVAALALWVGVSGYVLADIVDNLFGGRR